MSTIELIGELLLEILGWFKSNLVVRLIISCEISSFIHVLLLTLYYFVTTQAPCIIQCSGATIISIQETSSSLGRIRWFSGGYKGIKAASIKVAR